jgi:hypothetical protein
MLLLIDLVASIFIMLWQPEFWYNKKTANNKNISRDFLSAAEPIIVQ